MTVTLQSLIDRRDDLAKGAQDARLQAEDMRAQLAQVERNVIATEGAVMALTAIIEQETANGEEAEGISPGGTD